MAEPQQQDLNITFLDDPITMTFPFGDFKVQAGKLWTDPAKPNDPPKQLPDRYNYTVNQPGHGTGRDAVKFYLRADEWLHKTIQAAGVGRGVCLTIRHRVNPQDKKKKYWEVMKDGTITTSLDLDASPPADSTPPQETKPAPTQGDTASKEVPKTLAPPPDRHEPPHTADGSVPASQPTPSNGPAPALAFAEIACLSWKAHHAAYEIWAELGRGKEVQFHAENVQKTANSIFITTDRARIRPSESDMARFKAAMSPGQAPTPAKPPRPPGAPATGHGSPAGSDPADDEVWFDLCYKADLAGIPGDGFEELARRIVAGHLRTKALPAGYDMRGMPKACVALIEREIEEAAGERG